MRQVQEAVPMRRIEIDGETALFIGNEAAAEIDQMTELCFRKTDQDDKKDEGYTA